MSAASAGLAHGPGVAGAARSSTQPSSRRPPLVTQRRHLRASYEQATDQSSERSITDQGRCPRTPSGDLTVNNLRQFWIVEAFRCAVPVHA
jgi:hypothetical protein